jgi:hypothetical protein
MVFETQNHRLRERKTEGSEKKNLSISIRIRISISIEKRKYKEKSPRPLPENRKPESGDLAGRTSCRIFYAGSVPQNGGKIFTKKKIFAILYARPGRKETPRPRRTGGPVKWHFQDHGSQRLASRKPKLTRS